MKTVKKKSGKASTPKKKSNWFWNVALLLAIAVFAVSLWQLSEILMGYHEVDQEYEGIANEMEQQTVPVPTQPQQDIQLNESQETAAPGQATMEVVIETEEETEETEAPFVLYVPDFARLTSINSDVIGWIQIPGTKINYPIVQGSDNDYYLNHTVYGEENSGGAIFMDAAIEDGFEDKNAIIYGHNLKSGAMFSRLNRYARKSFWDANRYIYITTPVGMNVYEVFSAYQTTADADIYYYGFGEDQYYQDYLDRITSYSIFNAGVAVGVDDTIITLSTCANDTTQRFIVHAKKITE
ncbi:MAG: class B sortase [Lachnospiraceae bacterium]|nr:class B sortase [Lachnospiraceae bacterium]